MLIVMLQRSLTVTAVITVKVTREMMKIKQHHVLVIIKATSSHLMMKELTEVSMILQ